MTSQYKTEVAKGKCAVFHSSFTERWQKAWAKHIVLNVQVQGAF